MTLREITIDNSVRYLPQSEQTKERESKPNEIQNNSLPRKQNKNISGYSRKFFGDFAAKGIAILKRKMKFYY